MREDDVSSYPPRFGTYAAAVEAAQRLVETTTPAGGKVASSAVFELGGAEALLLATLDAEGNDHTIVLVTPSWSTPHKPTAAQEQIRALVEGL